jgi:hypothetical protein
MFIIFSIIVILILTFSVVTKAEETNTNPEDNQDSGDTETTSDTSDTSQNQETDNQETETTDDTSSEEDNSEDTSGTESTETTNSDPNLDPNGAYYELDESAEDIEVEEIDDTSEQQEETSNDSQESEIIQDSEDKEDTSDSQTNTSTEDSSSNDSQESKTNETSLEETDQNQTDSTNQTNSGYYEIDEETEDKTNNTPVIGNIVPKENNNTNITDYYVELDDVENVKPDDIDFEFSNLGQNEINFEDPVTVFQSLILKNDDDNSKNVSFNLWNYQKETLNGMRSIEVLKDGKIISEQPIFNIRLDAGEETEIELIYQYPKIEKTIERDDKTIMDLLPKQAKVVSSDLPVDTIINKRYNIRIYHEGPLHYFNINVPIDEIDKEDIESVYFVEGKTKLVMEDGVVVLPGLESQQDVQ